MIALLKKVWAKLDVPEDDWLLSRYGGCEPLNDVRASASGSDGSAPHGDAGEAPVSRRRSFINWFGEEVTSDEAAPPESREMSSNASYDNAPQDKAERRSRAS